MPADPQRVKELFGAAIDLSDPAERQAFLDRECADDAELRQQLEALLQAHDRPNPALEQPLAAAAESDPTAPHQPATHELAVGSLFAGRFKVREKLGEGGMGTVYVADQTEPVARRVALKVIRADVSSARVLARFEQERQALALMDHPNIAKVLDAGVAEGKPYFVMELIKGVPITKYCDEARLTPKQRLELFVLVCQAVQHAHQKGVIHRDLKPSNILVGLYDGKPIPKVIDFGVAKATGTKLSEHSVYTEVGQIVGTLEYMSPEQAELNNLDIDTRSDVYALGVVLYELLTGSVPLSRKELKKAGFAEMLRIIKEVEPHKPSTRLSSSGSLPSIAACRQTEPAKLAMLLRGDLDWVVMKALEKDRSRRYETANGLAMDVQRYLADEPVVAGPPGAGYRLRKFVKRNKPQVIAASLVLLALVGGVVGTTWGLLRASAARDAEAAQRSEAEIQRDKAVAAEKLAGERLAQVEVEQKRTLEQKARAEANEQKAEQEKRIAQAVRDFLQKKLLGQADVTKQADALLARGGFAAAANRDVTVRELLDRAAAELTPEKVEENFPRQHLVQAEILRTVGETYRGVGEPALAVTFLQRAAALCRQHLPPDDRQTLNTLHDLAAAYGASGKASEAIRLLEQVKQDSEKKLGANHRIPLTALHDLAVIFRDGGQFKKAIDLFGQVRQAREATLEADHPDLLNTLNHLGWAYIRAGKTHEAIRLFEKVRSAQEKKLGPEHPDTLATLNSLGGAYRDVGKPLEAMRLIGQVRDAAEKTFGPGHPYTLTAGNNLALIYQEMGQLAEAISLFQKVHEAREAKVGPEHPHTLETLRNLAWAYRAAGNLDEAIRLFQQVHPAQVKLLGPNNPDTLSTLNNLAGAYIKAGKASEGSKMVEVVLSRGRKGFPADSPPLADLLATTGNQLLDLKEYAKAEPLLREGLTIREKKEPDAWTTYHTQSLLGGALSGQKKYADAEPLLVKGYQGMKERAAKIPPQGKARLTEALERLVQLYEATGKKDEAARWRKEFEATKPSKNP